MSEQITGYSVAGVIEADPDSQFVWVKFVDAQTVTDVAVAAARAAGRKQGEQDQIDLTRDWGLHQHEVGRLQGQRDERERIVKAVEALPKAMSLDGGKDVAVWLDEVLAAIKDSKGTHVTEEQT